ncbi:hypothetical protein [Streptomyces sp.]|uniref:hypothetical protein n=1 Tax=Streptomyces sp. TaxID=1931 RepID=UPI002D79B743|nr:hypothetical protein [Streptomyces sp.]HET6358039.1 hypothetical protein [Streptomyces sp.]
MSTDNTHEPVFVRSAWGTNRYVYNPHNPAGLVLIVFSLLFAIGAMYYVQSSSKWSDGELREAVHQAAEALDASPVQKSEWTDHIDYRPLIDDAIEKSGMGPRYGVQVSQVDDDTNVYEITADGTDGVHCMTITEAAEQTVRYYRTVHLGVSVEDHGC